MEKLGGSVTYDYQETHQPEPPGPKWLRTLVGDDLLFAHVVAEQVPSATDASLVNLNRLSQLQSLDLGGSKITDSGLKHLNGLCQLLYLNLSSTQISDGGLGNLKGLDQLQQLDLGSTQITDAGLSCLSELHQLQVLDLRNTQVTDEGIPQLATLSQLHMLHLGQTKVTDAAVTSLQKAQQLRWLCLNQTRISNEAVRRLRQRLPNCQIATGDGKGHPSSVCQLVLEGRHIEKLLLSDEQGNQKEIVHPGPTVSLPSGNYWIVEIELHGGYRATSRGSIQSLSLSCDDPCQAAIGAPLEPNVTVKREGRLLKLDYRLLDANGRKTRRVSSVASTEFAIYQGDQKIGSGSFEYG